MKHTEFKKGDMLLQITQGDSPEDELREVVHFLHEGERSIWTVRQGYLSSAMEKELFDIDVNDIQQQEYPLLFDEAVVITQKTEQGLKTSRGYKVELETPKRVIVDVAFKEEFILFGDPGEQMRTVGLFKMDERLNDREFTIQGNALYDIEIEDAKGYSEVGTRQKFVIIKR